MADNPLGGFGLRGTDAPSPLDGVGQSPLVPFSPQAEQDQYGGEIPKGVRRGILSMIGTGQASLAQLLEPFAPKMADSLFEEATQTLNFPQGLQARVPRVQDIHDVGSGVDWATGQLAEVAPQGVAMAATGLLGGGAALGLRMNAARAAQLAAGSTFVPPAMGSTALALRNDPAAMQQTTPTQRALLSGGAGAGSAVLMSTPFFGAAKRALTGPMIEKGIAPALGHIGGEALRTGAHLGAASAGSTALELGAHSIANPQRDTSGDMEALKESAIGGGSVGALLGGVGGATRAVRSAFTPNVIGKAPPGTKALAAGYATAEHLDRAVDSIGRTMGKMANSVDGKLREYVRASAEWTDAKQQVLTHLLSEDSPVREALSHYDTAKQRTLIGALDAISAAPKLTETHPDLIPAIQTAFGGVDLKTVGDHLAAKQKLYGAQTDEANAKAEAALKALTPEAKLEYLRRKEDPNEMEQAMLRAAESIAPKLDEVSRSDESHLQGTKEETGIDIRGNLNSLLPPLEKPITPEVLSAGIQDMKYYHRSKSTDKVQGHLYLRAQSDTLSGRQILEALGPVQDSTVKKGERRPLTPEEIDMHDKGDHAILPVRLASLVNEVLQTPKEYEARFNENGVFDEVKYKDAVNEHYGALVPPRPEGQEVTDMSRKGDLAMATLSSLLNHGMEIPNPADPSKPHHVTFKTQRGGGVKGQDLPDNVSIGLGSNKYTVRDYANDKKAWTAKTREDLIAERAVGRQYAKADNNALKAEAKIREEQWRAARESGDDAVYDTAYARWKALENMRGRRNVLAAEYIKGILRAQGMTDADIKQAASQKKHGIWELVSKEDKNKAYTHAGVVERRETVARNNRESVAQSLNVMADAITEHILTAEELGQSTIKLIASLQEYVRTGEVDGAVQTFAAQHGFDLFSNKVLESETMKHKKTGKTPQQEVEGRLDSVMKMAIENSDQGVGTELARDKPVEYGSNADKSQQIVEETKKYWQEHGLVDDQGNVVTTAGGNPLGNQREQAMRAEAVAAHEQIAKARVPGKDEVPKPGKDSSGKDIVPPKVEQLKAKPTKPSPPNTVDKNAVQAPTPGYAKSEAELEKLGNAPKEPPPKEEAAPKAEAPDHFEKVKELRAALHDAGEKKWEADQNLREEKDQTRDAGRNPWWSYQGELLEDVWRDGQDLAPHMARLSPEKQKAAKEFLQRSVELDAAVKTADEYYAAHKEEMANHPKAMERFVAALKTLPEYKDGTLGGINADLMRNMLEHRGDNGWLQREIKGRERRLARYAEEFKDTKEPKFVQVIKEELKLLRENDLQKMVDEAVKSFHDEYRDAHPAPNLKGKTEPRDEFDSVGYNEAMRKAEDQQNDPSGRLRYSTDNNRPQYFVSDWQYNNRTDAAERARLGENAAYLSNHAVSPMEVKIEGRMVKGRTLESLYFAAQLKDPAMQDAFARKLPGVAKKEFKELPQSAKRDIPKTEIMLELTREKFRQNPDLAAKLLATGDRDLIHYAPWGDTYWGVGKDMKGLNNQGKLLMQVRNELRKAQGSEVAGKTTTKAMVEKGPTKDESERLSKLEKEKHDLLGGEKEPPYRRPADQEIVRIAVREYGLSFDAINKMKEKEAAGGPSLNEQLAEYIDRAQGYSGEKRELPKWLREDLGLVEQATLGAKRSLAEVEALLRVEAQKKDTNTKYWLEVLDSVDTSKVTPADIRALNVLKAAIKEAEEISQGKHNVGGLAQRTVDAWSQKYADGTPVQIAQMPKDKTAFASGIAGAHGGDASQLGGMSIRINGKNFIVTFEGGTQARSTSLARLAHEFGHNLQRVIFDKAPKDVQDRLRAQYKADMDVLRVDPSAIERFISPARLFGKGEAEYAESTLNSSLTKEVGLGLKKRVLEGLSKQLPQNPAMEKYITSFDEWFAEQFSKYVTSDMGKTIDPVLRPFWEKMYEKLKNFYNNVIRQFKPNSTFAEWADQLAKDQQAKLDMAPGGETKAMAGGGPPKEPPKPPKEVAAEPPEEPKKPKPGSLDEKVEKAKPLPPEAVSVEAGPTEPAKAAEQVKAAQNAMHDPYPDVIKKLKAEVQRIVGKQVDLVSGIAKDAKPGENAWTEIGNPKEYETNMAALRAVREGRRVALAEGRDATRWEAKEKKLRDKTAVLSLIRISPHLTEREALGAMYHESVHAAYHLLLNAEERAVLGTAFTKGTVGARLRELFKDQPAVLEHMKDAEEAAAYGFQIYATAPEMLQLGGKTQGIFAKVAKFFRNLAGILTPDEKAKIVMDDMLSGRRLERGSTPLQKLFEKDMTGVQKVQKLARTFGGVVKAGADVIAKSSYERLMSTNNPALALVADAGYTKQSTQDKPLGYVHAQRAAVTSFVNGLDKLFKGADLEHITAAVEARIMGKEPAEGTAARKVYDGLSRYFRDMHRYSVEAGVNIGFEKNYFPMGWDAEKVMNNKKAFLDMITKPEYAERMAELKVTPHELWENISNYVTRGESFQDVIAKKTHEPSNQYAKDRTLAFIKPEDRRLFMSDDHLQTLVRYTQSMIRQAEFVRSFGHGGEKLQNWLDEAKTKYGATPDQIALAKDYVDGLLGDKGIGMSRAQKDLYGAMIVYQNFRLLPFSLFSSLVDPLGIAVRSNSLMDAGSTFAYNIKNIFRDLKKDRNYESKDRWEKLAQDWGVIEDSGLMSNIGAMYENLDIRGTNKKLQEALFKYNLLNGWERNTKIMATKAAEKFMTRLKEDFFGDQNERYLKELDLKKSDLIIKPDGDLALRKEEMMAQGVSEEAAYQMEKRLADATVKFVNQSVLNPTAGDLPNWGSNPYFAPVFHLKQYMFTFQSTIMKRIAEEAKHGNYKPLMASTVYVPGMIAADMMRGYIMNYGSAPDWQKDWTAADYVLNGTERSGFFGVGSLVTGMVRSIKYGGTGFEDMMGPTLEEGKQLITALQGGNTAKFNFAVKAMPFSPVVQHAFIGKADPASTFVD